MTFAPNRPSAVRTIAAVTVGRSDFGIYRPILEAIHADPDLRLQVIVGGAHLAPEFGDTVREVEESGLPIAQRVDMLLSADTPVAISKSVGLGIIGFAQAYETLRPDALLLLGDRFEMHAAAVTAVPFKLPVAHVHGGEVTIGAIDDCLRHAITKCSHLHFPSTAEHARRIVQLGEHPDTVVVCGAPALDNLRRMKLLTREELSRDLKLPLEEPPLLVTYHPVTMQFEHTEWQFSELLAALDQSGRPIVFTKPNADMSSRTIIRLIEDFAAERPGRAFVYDNLGTLRYFSLMREAAAMVGNSSSGIIEAASFALPVVNIGLRQRGRPSGRNVLHVGNSREEITAGVAQAVDPQFRRSLQGLDNIYGQGRAAEVIVERLKQWRLDETTVLKTFYDLPGSESLEPCAAGAGER